MEEDMPDLPQPDAKLLDRPSRARYDKAHLALERRWRRRELKAERMMREVVDVLWDAFAGHPYVWCGFHLLCEGAKGPAAGPHRGQAVSPSLSLGAACVQAAAGGKPVIMLGRGQNPSRIILPVFDKSGQVWAVWAAESEKPAAFNEMDQRWLEKILKHFRQIGAPE